MVEVQLLMHLRRYIYENLAHDEENQVGWTVQVVVGPIFSQGVADSKQDGTERLKPDDFDAFVVAKGGTSVILHMKRNIQSTTY